MTELWRSQGSGAQPPSSFALTSSVVQRSAPVGVLMGAEAGGLGWVLGGWTGCHGGVGMGAMGESDWVP